jgi:hypothetical protein
MPPDRFDDVDFRFLEHPDTAEPPRRSPGRRPRRRFVAAVAVLAAGALTAGASIGLADTAQAPTLKGGASQVTYDADGVPTVRSGRHCMEGHGQFQHGSQTSTTPRY